VERRRRTAAWLHALLVMLLPLRLRLAAAALCCGWGGIQMSMFFDVIPCVFEELGACTDKTVMKKLRIYGIVFYILQPSSHSEISFDIHAQGTLKRPKIACQSD
jgi:hypothetical protein